MIRTLLLTWAVTTFASALTAIVRGSVTWSVETWITSTVTLVVVAIIYSALQDNDA